MGASNNKPLRSVPPQRRRRFNPRQQRTEIEVNDFSNDQQVIYNPGRSNSTQNDNFDPTSFWHDENQVYYNDQNYESRSNNVSSNNFGYQEGFPQYSNTEHNQHGALSNRNSGRNGENNAQSYFNNISTFSTPQPVSDYNFTIGFNGEYNSRPEAYNYGYCMGQPARPMARRHSLNNDNIRPHVNQFSQNSHRFHMQSCSLTNVNYENYYGGQSSAFGITSHASDSNIFQNHNSYSHNWNRSGVAVNRIRKCNSANGINTVINATRGGKKRNSLDEDFYGEDYSSSTSPDLYGSHQGFNSDFKLDNYVGPRVKRRPTCESQEGIYNRSNSALSFCNDIPYSDNTDFTNDNLDLESNQSDEQKNVLNILQFPSVWSSYSTNKTGFVNIPSTSLEGEKLRRFFHKTSRTRDFQLYIMGIARIENPFLHTLYLLKKEELKLRNGHVDELHLYHGTKKENISRICEDSFNWRLFSEKHKFGKGISFSPLASYSSHYCDNSDVKVMLLLKVLVSNATTGSPDMEIPPIIDDVTYDTSIKEDTSVIVKYCDNEFYPLYKITYSKRPI